MTTALLWGVALVVVSGLLAAPALRRRYPRSWWFLVGYPALWFRMRLTWRKLAWECDLAVSRRRSPTVVGNTLVKGRALDVVVPRLTIGVPRLFGVTARVRMEPGQVPDDFAAAAEAMMHAWRVHSVRVTSTERGTVRLTVAVRDPLASPTGAPASGVLESRQGGRLIALVASDRLPAVVDDRALLRATVGMREDSRPWVIDFRVVPHWLVCGATQSGKSTLVNALMVQLAPRPIALVGIDLKGGMALSPYAPRLSALATTRSGAARLLFALITEVTDRMALCRQAGVGSVWNLPDDVRPVPVVVIVDELAELYIVADRAEKQDAASCSANMVRLGQLGAGLGVHLLVAGQRVGSFLGPEAVALRAQLGGRICHRVTDPETAKMCLGDVFPDAVKAAQSIGPDDDERGKAVTTDERNTWIMARSAHTGIEQARRVAFDTRHLRMSLPGLDDLNGGWD